MLAPIGKDADDAQHRHADHLSGTAHAQGKAVKVDVDHIEVGERVCAPRLQAGLQRGDDARHRTLREGRGLEQRPKCSTNPTRITARQVRGDDRFVHFWHPPLIARQDGRGPFRRAEQLGAGHREGYRAARPRHGARLRAVPVATPIAAALVWLCTERGA